MVCVCVAIQEEMVMAMAAARRMSLAPVNRSTNFQSRQMSWRSGSMFWPRPPIAQGIIARFFISKRNTTFILKHSDSGMCQIKKS